MDQADDAISAIRQAVADDHAYTLVVMRETPDGPAPVRNLGRGALHHHVALAAIALQSLHAVATAQGLGEALHSIEARMTLEVMRAGQAHLDRDRRMTMLVMAAALMETAKAVPEYLPDISIH